MDANRRWTVRHMLTVFLVCFCSVIRWEVLAVGRHKRFADLDPCWPITTLFPVYCTIICTQSDFFSIDPL